MGENCDNMHCVFQFQIAKAFHSSVSMIKSKSLQVPFENKEREHHLTECMLWTLTQGAHILSS